MKIKTLLGQSGMSLLPVLAAIAGTGAITYFLIGQSDINNKSQAKANFDQATEAQIQQIQTELADYVNCTASFSGLAFGTTSVPTAIPPTLGIYKGTLNLLVNPPVVIKSSVPMYRVKAPNSVGSYIEKMTLLSRKEVVFDYALNTRVEKDMQDVLRVEFASGNVDASGVVRKGPKGIGATSISKDFVIRSEKAAGKIVTCYFDETNSVELVCKTVANAVWNETTKKCELPNAIFKSELIPLWSLVSGAISTIKPADVKNGEVTCQKSSKRCSRTNADCTLPACPANHYKSGAWEWDRKQSMFDKACMKSASCMYVAQPAGYIPKP